MIDDDVGVGKEEAVAICRFGSSECSTRTAFVFAIENFRPAWGFGLHGLCVVPSSIFLVLGT